MSLKIEKKNEGTKDTVFLTGRLDTATAPELDTFCLLYTSPSPRDRG